MYELHKTWCADTLLSNSVICAIGVLQHDKQKCWSPKCISSALLKPRPLSILGTKVLMPRVDYASLQPCCSLWLFVQLELYSALSLDYAVVVAMSCFCMCYAIQ